MTQIDWSKAPEWATHWFESGQTFLRVDDYGSVFYEGNGMFHPNGAHIKHYNGSLTPRPTLTWNGEGLPPLGLWVEWCCHEGEWVEARIVSHAGECDYVIQTKEEKIIVGNPSNFRPLKSPRERWVEAAEKLLSQCAADEPLSYLCALTYDAMQSGTLPLPEAGQ